jgi:hypothetical protein
LTWPPHKTRCPNSPPPLAHREGPSKGIPFGIEAKLSTTTSEPSLTYFRDRLRIPWAYQVVLEGKRDFVQNDIRCVPARQFLGALV